MSFLIILDVTFNIVNLDFLFYEINYKGGILTNTKKSV